MNIINKIIKQFTPSKVKPSQIEFNCESLDIDKLSEVYALSKDRVGKFLQSELGWSYQQSIILSPLDCQLDILEVDHLADYSAIILMSSSTQKRFVTSNPDLILESKEIYERYSRLGYVFQIASRETIDYCFKRFLAIKKALIEVGSDERKQFGVLFISLFDCLGLGVTEITYRDNKYIALRGSEKYEGELSVSIISIIRAELMKKGSGMLEGLLADLGCTEKLHMEVRDDGFRLKFGLPEVENLQETVRERKHILLVDDDQRFVDILKRSISLKGFRVSVASTAKQAVEYLNTPDVNVNLVISDFHMPNHTGASLITSIRNVDQNLPIIGLTGDSQSQSQVSFINAGANAIVKKSDEPQVLFAWIYKFLDDEHRLRAA